MNMKDLAFSNVKNRKRSYGAHFFSSSFAVMIFFIYAILIYHPQLKDGIQATSPSMAKFATMGMQVSQYVIVIFSFFFIMYSVSAFLQTRKKEFGLMMMLGMTNRQLNRLLFIENMIIGCLSIVTGIAAGLLFSKVFLFGAEKLLMLDKGLKFFIPWKGVGLTFGIFFLVFIIISLFTSRFVRVNEMIELLKGDRKPKKEPKPSIFLSFLALLFIGASYILVYLFATEPSFAELHILLAVVLFAIIGTYFLFSQLNVYVMKKLQKNESFLFRRTNMLTIPELTYRMRDNSNMFFMIAIVSAVAFTAVGTIAAAGNQVNLVKTGNPYAMYYHSHSNNEQEKEHVALIEKEMSDAGFANKKANLAIKPLPDIEGQNYMEVMSVSTFNKTSQLFNGQQISLSGNDAVLIPGTIMNDVDFKTTADGIDTLLIGELNEEIHVSDMINELIVPQYRFSSIIAVIPDDVYDRIPISAQEEDDFRNEQHLIGYVVDDILKTTNVSQTIFNKIYQSEDVMYNGSFSFHSLAQDYIMSKQMNGILLIVGLLVGIVFFVSASSFIYFRLYSDVDRDRRQYRMISKLGLTRKELSKVLTTQLFILFFAPIIVACVHSGMAFFALQQLLKDMWSIAGITLIVLAFFLALQIVYYLIIRWRYVKMMQRELV